MHFKKQQKIQVFKEKNNLNTYNNLTIKSAAYNKIISHYYWINYKRENVFTVN